LGMSSEAYLHQCRKSALGMLRNHAVVCVVRQMGNGVDRISGAELVPIGLDDADALPVDLSGDNMLLDCVSVALSALSLAAVIGANHLARCFVRPLYGEAIELTAVFTECLVDMLLAG